MFVVQTHTAFDFDHFGIDEATGRDPLRPVLDETLDLRGARGRLLERV
jgi:hypothetical protein